MFDAVLSLFAPHICLQCGSEGLLWCSACQKNALPAVERCYRCHALADGGRTCASCRSSSALYSVRAATRYEGYAKQLIWKLKFERAQAGAGAAAELMASRLNIPEGLIIVPLPTSTNRVRRRGYDQTVLIARRLAKRYGLRNETMLMRLGQQQQHTARRAQRLSQLSHAFVAPWPDKAWGKHILLIDDVITTGATLEAAARVLKAAGAKRVSAIVFAQA